MMKVAIAQTKIFRMPVIGFIHAMVFWGFIIITIGSIEMVFDGALGLDRSFAFMGPLYNLIIGLGDFFAWFILAAMIIFLFRRIFLNIKRFKGAEMKPISKLDANIALTIILFLMVSLIGMNIFYLAKHPYDYLLAGSLLVPSLLETSCSPTRVASSFGTNSTGGRISCSSSFLPISSPTRNTSMSLFRFPMSSSAVSKHSVT